MRGAWISVVAVAALLVGAAPVSAGVYCLDKGGPDESFVPTTTLPFGSDGVKPWSYEPFRVQLDDFVDICNSRKEVNPRREKFLARRTLLQRIVRDGGTLEDKINLSAYHIWLGEYKEAIDLLRPIAEDERTKLDPHAFVVFANLATALQLTGALPDAGYFMIQVRKSFPKAGTSCPGFTAAQLDWFREAEKYQFNLLKLRIPEAPKLPAERSKSVEDLFGVNFVGESGKYEAGKIAAAEKEKLPKNAVPIVQQLLLWLPEAGGYYDLRLFWLLGELYNAEGKIFDAYDVLDRCVSNREASNIPDLFEHRRIIKAALPPPPEPKSWIPDTTTLIIVGTGTGLVVLFLAYLQVREFRRRRQVEHH